jgi:hypothetical protein
MTFTSSMDLVTDEMKAVSLASDKAVVPRPNFGKQVVENRNVVGG